MKREVRIDAFDKRYKSGAVFQAIPYYDYSIDNYVTGQEKRIGRPNGLTKEQIEGVDKKIKDEQRIAFPYIIRFSDNFRGIPIRKGLILNLSTSNGENNYVNPRHKAIYDFLVSSQRDIVASSKKDCESGKHLFYFVDEVKEAEQRVLARRAFFKASKLVNDNLDIDSYYELLMYVNYIHNETYNVFEKEKSLLEDYTNEVCEKYTDTVIKFFNKESQDELFILKLVEHGIILFKDGAFIDKKDQYLGTSPSEVNSYLLKKGNNLKGVHWRRALSKVDKRFLDSINKEKKEEEEKEKSEE